MTDSLSDDAPKVRLAQSYRSDQLAALLEVFSVWSSGSFMRGLAAGAGLDLDATSIVAITLLARDGDQRASALAARLRVGASAISKLSNRLSAIELVEKLPDPGDTRATLLRLTPAGRAAARALVQAGDTMMAELMREWPEDDRAHFNRLLRRFRDDAILHAVRTETATRPSTDPRKL
ncbi:winged helix DNA-binding protein [Cryobacterium sp. SO2]|uniref:MarR family winged helix-turn-helix transcriptional regulator n=1 Tax=Cryobacterium sp. SO2 TaxID=1897060 RepID=UPI00223DD0D1|nr:MarR family transcriptional regulator [Cryobacterium sp. SO2]WEO75988.1 winged helix DNA-binding protein [Cryobacterium sp. SO2]